MPTNPFTDVWHFLTATTNDYLHQGNWRFLILALFWALLLVSIAVAIQNWREDPTQRSGRHLGIWLVRVLIGCMWFQGTLWKLPSLGHPVTVPHADDGRLSADRVQLYAFL